MDVAEYLQITEFGTEELVQWGEMTLCVRASDTMVLPPPPGSITEYVTMLESASVASMRSRCARPLGADRLALRPSDRRCALAQAMATTTTTTPDALPLMSMAETSEYVEKHRIKERLEEAIGSLERWRDAGGDAERFDKRMIVLTAVRPGDESKATESSKES